jgi:hypothetical protein
MSSWYIRDCGHETLRDPWGTDEPEPLSGLCWECCKARIGEMIEFVRYGEPPSSQSFNYRDGTYEEGVSVYELVEGKPHYVGWYFNITDRPEYKGTGKIVGWGSDGEPVVQIHTISPA